jgi:hypothetical protein
MIFPYKIAQGDTLSIPDVRNSICKGNRIKVINLVKQKGALLAKNV